MSNLCSNTRIETRLLAACVVLLAFAQGVHAQAKPTGSQSTQSTPPAAATTAAPTGEGDAAAPEAGATEASAAEAPPSAAGASDASGTPALEPTPAAADPKVAALRGELSGLMDDLVAARARTAVLGKTLFKTKIAVRVQNLAAPDPVLVKLVISLDGTTIYRGDSSTLTGDEAHAVFDGFAAPGPHLLQVELEQRAQTDSAFGYTQRDTYKLQAKREKETRVTLVLDDDSDLASDFADDGEGEYDVRTRVRVETRALAEKNEK